MKSWQCILSGLVAFAILFIAGVEFSGGEAAIYVIVFAIWVNESNK